MTLLIYFTEGYFDIALSLALQSKQMQMYRRDAKLLFFTRPADIIQTLSALVFAIFILGLIVFQMFL